SELMGLTVYQQLDKMLESIVGDEPDVRDRVRELLRAIMTDELSHVGERRNFMGPIGVRVAKLMVRPMFRAFFGGIPEARLLFDTRQMRKDAEAFVYSTISPEVLDVSWTPSYCMRPQPPPRASAAVRLRRIPAGPAETPWRSCWRRSESRR